MQRFQYGDQPGARLWRHRSHRPATGPRGQTDHLHRSLHYGWKCVQGERLAQRLDHFLQAGGVVKPAVAKGTIKIDKGARSYVRAGRHRAGCASLQSFQDQVVTPDENRKWAIQPDGRQLRNLVELARRIFEACEVFTEMRNTPQGINRQLDPGALGNVVGEHGNPHRAANVAVVLDQLVLRRAQIIRRDDHCVIDTLGFTSLRQANSFARAYRAYIAIEGGAPAHRLPAKTQRHGALFFIQRVEFSLAARGEQPVHAAFHLDIDDPLPGLEGDAFVFAERGHQRGDDALRRAGRHVFILTLVIARAFLPGHAKIKRKTRRAPKTPQML